MVLVNNKYFFHQMCQLAFLIILPDQHIAILAKVQYC